MSLKQLVLDMTPEARKELVELIASVEAKEAELASETAVEVSKPNKSAPKAEARVAVASPGDAEAPVA